ncbi:hypothetical protein [Phytohabitans rumicis]|uniref:Uncharacterized protein n=1 Tax=Phytohabitans rumicis TaxID=1076125 RepID=A0A6V8L8R6_9ACTN|nr:hypothetical protein [Phytohabitans rumicis]GFJ91980.1 hypothetical protein Prum_056220 [Phytohabitans rumicis]
MVAFRVRVTAERSVFKLSQDQDAATRARVAADAPPALARLMEDV